MAREVSIGLYRFLKRKLPMSINNFQLHILEECIKYKQHFDKDNRVAIFGLEAIYSHLGKEWTPTTEQNKVLNRLSGKLGEVKKYLGVSVAASIRTGDAFQRTTEKQKQYEEDGKQKELEFDESTGRLK
jgi:hypothetical protein